MISNLYQSLMDKLTVYSMYGTGNLVVFLSEFNWVVFLTTTALVLRLMYDTVRFWHWFKHERKGTEHAKQIKRKSIRSTRRPR